MPRAYTTRLAEATRATGSIACVGIDPMPDRLPRPLALPEGADRDALAAAYEAFGCGVVRAVAGLVPAVKPQSAFFEVLGAPGVAALEAVCRAAREAGLLVVLDAKRGDIGTTAEAYARATLDDDGPMAADAVTVNPYLGPESLAPFLARVGGGKGVYVLLRTSNARAAEWQGGGNQAIASRVAAWLATLPVGDSGYTDVGAVIGATLADEAADWRARLPRTPVLVPGFGAQGGTLAALRGLRGPDGGGMLVVSARAVLYPPHGRDGDDWERQIAARAHALNAELSAGLR